MRPNSTDNFFIFQKKTVLFSVTLEITPLQHSVITAQKWKHNYIHYFFSNGVHRDSTVSMATY
jgi:hypothetical protein